MAKTILIVDDSQSIRAVIGAKLKIGGHTTIFAEDGKQALDILA